MADEKQNPVPVDPDDAPEELEAAQNTDVRELRETHLEDLPKEDLPAGFAARQEVEAKDSDAREGREAVEGALDKPIDAIEDAIETVGAEHSHAPAHVGDTTVIFGQTLPFPLYTVVFGVLAVTTVLEVVIAELPEGVVGTGLLIGLSVMKAVLVVLFYMHLREDSRIFALALIIPLFISIVALIFLLSVPTTGY